MRNCRKTRHKTPLSADEQADMQAKIQYQGVSARETSFDAKGLNESERGPGYFNGRELAELASYVRKPIPSSMNIIYSNDRDRPRPTKMLMRRTIDAPSVSASERPFHRSDDEDRMVNSPREKDRLHSGGAV